MTETNPIIILNKTEVLPRNDPNTFIEVRDRQIVFRSGDVENRKLVTVRTYPDGRESMGLLGRSRFDVFPRQFIELTVLSQESDTQYTIEYEAEDAVGPNRPVIGHIKVVKTF